MTLPDWDGVDWDDLQSRGRPEDDSDLKTDWEWHYPSSDEEYGEPVRRVWANVLNGKIPLTALDEEELIEMRLRDKTGVLRRGGGGPTRLPQGLRRERARLLVEQAEDSDMQFLSKAVKVRQQIAADENLDPAVRLRAALASEERARGKVADKVEMTQTVKPYEGLLADILVNVQEATEAPNQLE